MNLTLHEEDNLNNEEEEFAWFVNEALRCSAESY